MVGVRGVPELDILFLGVMTWEIEVADKFLGCTEFAKWPSTKSKKIIDTVRNLEKVKDIRILGNLLSK